MSIFGDLGGALGGLFGSVKDTVGDIWNGTGGKLLDYNMQLGNKLVDAGTGAVTDVSGALSQLLSSPLLIVGAVVVLLVLLGNK